MCDIVPPSPIWSHRYRQIPLFKGHRYLRGDGILTQAFCKYGAQACVPACGRRRCMWHERSSHVAFHVACSHVACHVIWASAKVGSCCVLMFASGHCTRSAALDCLPMIFTLETVYSSMACSLCHVLLVVLIHIRPQASLRTSSLDFGPESGYQITRWHIRV